MPRPRYAPLAGGLTVTLSLSLSSGCVQILGVERLPIETSPADAGDGDARPSNGTDGDGAATETGPARWCTEAASDAGALRCDDFDQPTSAWQPASPWDIVPVVAGAATLTRVPAGAGASMPFELAGEAQTPSNVEAQARLRAVLSSVSRIAVAFDVVATDVTLDGSVVRLVLGASSFVDVHVARAGSSATLSGYLRLDGSGAREDFDTTLVQLGVGVRRRVRLDASQSPPGTWAVRASVDGTLVAERVHVAGASPSVAVELGARAPFTGTHLRALYDNVTLETW